MAKQKTNLRYIFKINSSRLRKSRWNLNLSIKEAKDNNELVSLADSTTIRFLTDGLNVDEVANKILKEIKKAKKCPVNKENKDKIYKLYSELYDTLFIKDYVCVVIDKVKDFDRMNSKRGFFINGIKYKRLLATNGGVKKNIVVYVNESKYEDLNTRINNGRNLDKKLVPAKLEAYKSLTCSASVPVSNPKGILVVNDCDTEFLSDVILLDDTETEYPKMTYEKDYKIKLTENDGYGLILPSLSEKWTKELGEDYIAAGFCVRNSFCKGMTFTFDFLDFAENIAKKYIVKDAWGAERDIRSVDLILTTSMLKLWDSYDSLEHYLDCCNKNGYTFSVTKITPKKLENERNLNYQFIQSYEFDDADIDELTKPTIEEIQDVLGKDPIKSILFLKGVHLSEDDYDKQDADFVKALMIDKRMINDPFVKSKIQYMIKKRITEAKIGVLKVHGNFSIVSGDPYSLCQSIFELEVTGLLKAGEFYSKYWNDRNVDKVVAYRAPMTCHNNIRVLRFKNTEEMQRWYKYMNTVTIFNSWDTTAHAMNGLDKDADIVMETDNPVLLRRTKELPAVLCVQKTAEKKVAEEEDFVKANKNGFGDEIGSTTNKITAMIDVASAFDKDSEEYKELQYRIICGQNYQQNAIDKMKGILCKPMPKEWYDYYSAKDSENKDLNLKILADKKPYFFIYNYPQEMKKYKKYIANSNKNCLMRFGINIDELIDKHDKTDDEQKFLQFYYKKMPVFINKSTMNRICWKIEEAFDDCKDEISSQTFDYRMLMSYKTYSKKLFNQIKKIYEEYLNSIRQHSQTKRSTKNEKDDAKTQRDIFKDEFKQKAYKICNNSEELCNIVVDMCYKNNSSKQFAWDICGDIIIQNLLKKNNYTIQYPIADDNGEIEFGGNRFSLYTRKLDCEVDYEINIK